MGGKQPVIAPGQEISHISHRKTTIFNFYSSDSKQDEAY